MGYNSWMRQHKWFNLAVIIIYFCIVVLPHKRFGTFLNDVVFQGITRDQYNLYVAIGFGVIFILLGTYLVREAMKRDLIKQLSIGLVINLIIAALVVNVLFVINIEMVHFPQYAMLTVLVYPLLGNYSQTLVICTLLGVVDEAYQYFYLAPKDTSYYDFNDIVTDIIGVVFGLLLLKALRFNKEKVYNFWTSPASVATCILIGVVTFTHIAGVLSIYPSEEHTHHLLRIWPVDFWSFVKPNVTFHIMRPIEGTTASVVLLYFWSRYFESF